MSSHAPRIAREIVLHSSRSQVRATDLERERAAARITRAYSQGCLTADEFDARLERAYGARTRADLVRLTRDLPRDPDRFEPLRRAMFRWHVTSYGAVNGGLVAAWLATGGPFWPAFSMAPWGAFLALHAKARRSRRRRRRA